MEFSDSLFDRDWLQPVGKLEFCPIGASFAWQIDKSPTDEWTIDRVPVEVLEGGCAGNGGQPRAEEGLLAMGGGRGRNV
jgi:hypothetical protein